MPVLLERERPSKRQLQAVYAYIIRQREKEKQALAESRAKEEEEKRRKREEEKKKETVDDVKLEIEKLESKLESLKNEKHQMFLQLKKVLSEDEEKRQRERQAALAAMIPPPPPVYQGHPVMGGHRPYGAPASLPMSHIPHAPQARVDMHMPLHATTIMSERQYPYPQPNQLHQTGSHSLMQAKLGVNYPLPASSLSSSVSYTMHQPPAHTHLPPEPASRPIISVGQGQKAQAPPGQAPTSSHPVIHRSLSDTQVLYRGQPIQLSAPQQGLQQSASKPSEVSTSKHPYPPGQFPKHDTSPHKHSHGGHVQQLDQSQSTLKIQPHGKVEYSAQKQPPYKVSGQHQQQFHQGPQLQLASKPEHVHPTPSKHQAWGTATQQSMSHKQDTQKNPYVHQSLLVPQTHKPVEPKPAYQPVPHSQQATSVVKQHEVPSQKPLPHQSHTQSQLSSSQVNIEHQQQYHHGHVLKGQPTQGPQGSSQHSTSTLQVLSTSYPLMQQTYTSQAGPGQDHSAYRTQQAHSTDQSQNQTYSSQGQQVSYPSQQAYSYHYQAQYQGYPVPSDQTHQQHNYQAAPSSTASGQTQTNQSSYDQSQHTKQMPPPPPQKSSKPDQSTPSSYSQYGDYSQQGQSSKRSSHKYSPYSYKSSHHHQGGSAKTKYSEKYAGTQEGHSSSSGSSHSRHSWHHTTNRTSHSNKSSSASNSSSSQRQSRYNY